MAHKYRTVKPSTKNKSSGLTSKSDVSDVKFSWTIDNQNFIHNNAEKKLSYKEFINNIVSKLNQHSLKPWATFNCSSDQHTHRVDYNKQKLSDGEKVKRIKDRFYPESDFWQISLSKGARMFGFMVGSKFHLVMIDLHHKQTVTDK